MNDILTRPLRELYQETQMPWIDIPPPMALVRIRTTLLIQWDALRLCFLTTDFLIDPELNAQSQHHLFSPLAQQQLRQLSEGPERQQGPRTCQPGGMIFIKTIPTNQPSLKETWEGPHRSWFLLPLLLKLQVSSPGFVTLELSPGPVNIQIRIPGPPPRTLPLIHVNQSKISDSYSRKIRTSNPLWRLAIC